MIHTTEMKPNGDHTHYSKYVWSHCYIVFMFVLTVVMFLVINGRLQSLDWTSGLDWWTGLVDWTGGLTLKIIFMVSNKTH